MNIKKWWKKITYSEPQEFGIPLSLIERLMVIFIGICSVIFMTIFLLGLYKIN